MAKLMFLSRQLQEIIFSKKPLSMFLLLLTIALCTGMTKNDLKFCQHVSQYEGKEYMIDLGVVTPSGPISGSISIPFMLYMGGEGALQPLYWTYMYL